jgi:large subunit ribosomal protein L15
MQLHELKHQTKRQPSRRVGRGGKRGKTSGRGTKGAGARAGNKGRPEWRDIIKKLPKRRGYGKNRGRTVVGSRVKPVAVSLARLESLAAETITPSLLVRRGVIAKVGGKLPGVKIVGTSVNKALSVEGCLVSQGARAVIEKAGGSVK